MQASSQQQQQMSLDEEISILKKQTIDLQSRLNYVQSQLLVTDEVGMISSFAGSTLPKGYLECDGSRLLIADYPSLYVVIGRTYNRADNTDTSLYFDLPDLRNMFVRGLDTSSTVQQRTLGSTQDYATALPRTQPFMTNTSGEHTHKISMRLTRITSDGISPLVQSSSGSQGITEFSVHADGAHTHVVTSGGDEETRPRNISLYYIIRAQ